MLPVSTGFIFPDGSKLETGGIGHRKCADEYIKNHGLQKDFHAYKGDTDDYLIERLGAIKVCQYRGDRFLYMPNITNWYLNKISKIYIRYGYKVIFLRAQLITDVLRNEMIEGENYNLTVVKDVDSDGKTFYKYNPMRIGD